MKCLMGKRREMGREAKTSTLVKNSGFDLQWQKGSLS